MRRRASPPREFHGVESHAWKPRCLYCTAPYAGCQCTCIICGLGRRKCKCSGEVYAQGLATLADSYPECAGKVSAKEIETMRGYEHIFIARWKVDVALIVAREDHRSVCVGAFNWCVLCDESIIGCSHRVTSR